MAHRFGGQWTVEKLAKVKDYLQTYVTSLQYQNFQLLYVDAFAGTGYVKTNEEGHNQTSFPEFEDGDTKGFISGSAANALGVTPPFDEYYFIEKSEKRVAELQLLKIHYPDLEDRIFLESGDANTYLQNFCKGDWRSRRAVIFLDPYGMQVKWKTIESIAATESIDLWIFVSLRRSRESIASERREHFGRSPSDSGRNVWLLRLVR
jgi:three-Cys-motif partner protein